MLHSTENADKKKICTSSVERKLSPQIFSPHGCRGSTNRGSIVNEGYIICNPKA